MPPESPHLRHYTRPAVLLHWVSALAIGLACASGLMLAGLAMSLLKLKLMNWHKWIGMTTLALAVLRVAWRVRHRPPPWPATMTAAQRSLATGAHVCLYLLMLAVPLLGWAYSSAAGFPIVWFGVIELPDWVPRHRQLAELIRPLHQAASYGLVLLAIAHAAAALKHALLDRDGLMARMQLR